jgi:hypothetical protein
MARCAGVPLLRGINHLTLITHDMDRLVAFYGPPTPELEPDRRSATYEGS